MEDDYSDPLNAATGPSASGATPVDNTNTNFWGSFLSGLGTTVGQTWTAVTNSQTAAQTAAANAAAQKAAAANTSTLTKLIPFAIAGVGVVFLLVLVISLRRK